MNLTFITTVNAGTLCITVNTTRLDAAIAGDLKAGVEAAWPAGVHRVEINLGAVEFIDSSGVGALISIFRKSRSVAGGIRLSQVRPGVQAVLDLLHLGPLFGAAGESEASPAGTVTEALA